MIRAEVDFAELIPPSAPPLVAPRSRGSLRVVGGYWAPSVVELQIR